MKFKMKYAAKHKAQMLKWLFLAWLQAILKTHFNNLTFAKGYKPKSFYGYFSIRIQSNSERSTHLPFEDWLEKLIR